MNIGRAAASGLSLAVVFLSSAAAENWLKIDPNDPYSSDGTYHLFDVDSAFEDRATGFVAASMTFMPPASAAPGGVANVWLWAFDCSANTVFYVSSQSVSAGLDVTADWRSQLHPLSEPVMGGVTNMFGRKLCALKGSWPLGDLP